jgi:hypothetical protein
VNIMKLLYLILGWLFGLLSPLIVNLIRRAYSKKELFNAIRTEIKECQIRVLYVTNLLGFRCGKFDKEFLNWCLSYFQNYKGVESIEDAIESIEYFLSVKDEDIENVLALKRAMEKNHGLSLKKFYLPFLDSKIDEVSFFNIELQNIIYDIKSRLQLINEEIDSTIAYFHMTFDSSMSHENHDIVKKELIRIYITLQEQLIILVKKMDNFIDYKNKI